jgi:hypothetical protein
MPTGRLRARAGDSPGVVGASAVLVGWQQFGGRALVVATPGVPCVIVGADARTAVVGALVTGRGGCGGSGCATALLGWRC